MLAADETTIVELAALNVRFPAADAKSKTVPANAFKVNVPDPSVIARATPAPVLLSIPVDMF